MARTKTQAIALARPPVPLLRVLHAEARVRELLAEVLALDADVERLRAELVAFDARWRSEVAPATAELEDAERLVRRLGRIEDDVAAASRPAERRTRRDAAARARRAEAGAPPRPRAIPAGARGEDAVQATDLEPEDAAVKRLHRWLARALHPDLSPDERDRVRRSEWMALANAAYRRRDLVALEILAARAGAGHAATAPSDAERLARLARRERTLRSAREALEAEAQRLRRSDAFALRARAEAREAEGGDLAAEARRDALARAAALRDAAAARWDVVARGAGGLGPEAVRRSIRSGAARAVVRLEQLARPSARAHDLERELAAAAVGRDRWRAALVVAAALGEGGESLPEGMSTFTALAARWDALRAGWPGAPDLARALAATREVEPALRSRGAAVELAPRVTSRDLAAAVAAALEGGPLADLAREVLAVLGPEERCARCRHRVFARHVPRLHGIDQVHGLACPRCGATLRGYWRYGGPRGVEGLWPIALRLGMASAVEVRLGRAALSVGLLPHERARLTAGALCRIFHSLCLAPHGVPVRAEQLRVTVAGRPLGPRARVPSGEALAVSFDGSAPLTPARAASAVRHAVERRFRG